MPDIANIFKSADQGDLNAAAATALHAIGAYDEATDQLADLLLKGVPDNAHSMALAIFEPAKSFSPKVVKVLAQP